MRKLSILTLAVLVTAATNKTLRADHYGRREDIFTSIYGDDKYEVNQTALRHGHPTVQTNDQWYCTKAVDRLKKGPVDLFEK